MLGLCIIGIKSVKLNLIKDINQMECLDLPCWDKNYENFAILSIALTNFLTSFISPSQIEHNNGLPNIVTHVVQTRNHVFVGGNLDGIHIHILSPKKCLSLLPLLLTLCKFRKEEFVHLWELGYLWMSKKDFFLLVVMGMLALSHSMVDQEVCSSCALIYLMYISILGG